MKYVPTVTWSMQRTLVCIVTACQLLIANMFAQDLEADPLPGCGLDSALFAEDMNRGDRSTLLGYNWTPAADSSIGDRFHGNLWHLDDPFLGEDFLKSFKRNARPGMLLIVNVDSIGVVARDAGTAKDAIPLQAFAMEYQPWLAHSYNTRLEQDTFSLMHDDSSGGIYGFLVRNGGGVEKSSDDNYYRYTLDPTSVGTATPFVALDSVCLDNELHNWFRGPSEALRSHNTAEMWFSINLRRLNFSSDDGRADDTVLIVELPYRFVGGISGGTISLRAVPKRNGDRSIITGSLGRRMGYAVQVDTVDTAPTTLVITRRMIPQFGDVLDADVTINVMFLCDKTPGNLEKGYNNPQFRYHRGDVDTNHIERLGIRVTYHPSIAIGIRWCRLQSTNAKDLFSGVHDRQIRNGILNFLNNLHAYNNASVSPLEPSNRLKLWRVNNRDEVEPFHWKTYRYIDRLLHGLTATERLLADPVTSTHCMNPKDFWIATQQLHPFHAAAFYRKGHLSYNRDVRDYANLKRGRSDNDGYETNLETFDGSYTSPLPVPTELITKFLRVGIGPTAGGPLQCFEDYLRLCYMHRSFLFDTIRPYLANIWSYSLVVARNAPVKSLTFGDNGRPKSPGEQRYACMMPIVLGAKGLLHCLGTSEHPFPSNDSTWPRTLDGNPVANVDRYLGLMHFGAENILVDSSADIRIDHDSLGGDYAMSSDQMHIARYLYNGLNSVATNLNSGEPDDRIYVGLKSMRQVTREVHDLVAGNAEIIRNLHLVGWHARGFQKWLIGDSLMYRRFLSDDDSRVRVRKPYLLDDQLQPAVEDVDSTFFDVTLHRSRTVGMDSVFYVMVQNRRTNDLTGTSDSLGTFWTWSEWKAHVDSFPSERYSQRGAREITIPFNYQSNGPLHVKEWSHSLSSFPIDTVVGSESALALRYLPGQARMFEVRPLRNHSALGDTVSIVSIVSIHPSPAQDVLHLVLNGPCMSIAIHDIEGRRVTSLNGIEAGTVSIDIRNLSTGVYSLHALCNEMVDMKTFIVLR